MNNNNIECRIEQLNYDDYCAIGLIGENIIEKNGVPHMTYKDQNIFELNDSNVIANILNKAFMDFAKEFNFTKENAPNHLAFVNSDGIEVWLKNGLKMYGYKIDDEIIGCAGYSFYDDQTYLIERLATLPEYRNLGIGKKMMEFIENKIRNNGGKIVEIHVTDKKTVLREWYKKQGYEEIKIEEVHIPGIEKVPFKACVMNKKLTEK